MSLAKEVLSSIMSKSDKGSVGKFKKKKSAKQSGQNNVIPHDNNPDMQNMDAPDKIIENTGDSTDSTYFESGKMIDSEGHAYRNTDAPRPATSDLSHKNVTKEKGLSQTRATGAKKPPKDKSWDEED